jgi:hypothetical protein
MSDSGHFVAIPGGEDDILTVSPQKEPHSLHQSGLIVVV